MHHILAATTDNNADVHNTPLTNTQFRSLPLTIQPAVANPDGSPHVTPVGFAQCDGVWYFTSGPRTRKSRNIAADPRCVVSVATHPFDLVIEGTASRVTDAEELRSVAEQYNREGWPAQVDGDALTAEYSAPSAGPPPWYVYRITPATVFAFGTAEPYGATKFELTR